MNYTFAVENTSRTAESEAAQHSAASPSLENQICFNSLQDLFQLASLENQKFVSKDDQTFILSRA